MPLSPPVSRQTGRPRRETVLLYGPSGIGKTHGALQLAAKSTGRCFYLDMDSTLEASLEEFPELTVEAYPAYGWEEIRTAGKEIVKLAGEGDWIVLDLVGTVWSEAQRYYHELMGGYQDGVDLAEDRLRAEAKKGKVRSNLEGWEWQFPNALHDGLLQPIMLGTKAHVCLIAGADELMHNKDGQVTHPDKHVRTTFGEYGWKPVGKKDNVYKVHTCLLLHWGAGRRRLMTGVKDRGRELAEREEYTDLAVSYLLGRAGWAPA